MENYYELFDIRRDATIGEIKIAYKKALHRYHPDVNRSTDAVMLFKSVMRGYKVLSSPELREEYDREYTTYFIQEKSDKRQNSNTKKIKFVFSFGENGISRIFSGIKKARRELKLKKFLEREYGKFTPVNESEYIEKLSTADLKIRLQNNSNCFVRINALKICSARKESSLLTEIILLLKDSDERVRAETINTLAILKDFRALNFIINAINDHSESVKFTAAKGLRNFADPRAVNGLKVLLNSSSEEIVCEAIYSLGVIGDSSIYPLLQSFFERSRSRKIRKTAIEVLKLLEE